MIWGSISLMTGFGVAILMITLVTLCTMWRYRHLLVQVNLLVGLFVVVSGLALIGLFYLADLVTMWVMPLITTQKTALVMMSILHLHYSWINMLAVSLCIYGGFVCIMRRLLFLIGRLQESEANLHREISICEQANHALPGSEERFRDLIEGSIQGILIHRDNKALFVNPAYAAIFGYKTPDEICALDTLLALIAPHERERLMEYREARLAGKAVPNHYVYQGVRKDGTRVWLDMTVRVVTWDGQPAMQSIVVDITERKRAEEQLRFQAQLLDCVQESVVATDLEGCITYWGKGAEALYGYRADEVIGTPITFIVGSPEEQEEEQQRMRIVAETGTWQGQYVQQRKDGSQFWVDTVIALVTDPHGQPCGYVGIDRDLTAQKQTEEALLASEELNRYIVEAVPGGIVQVSQEGGIVHANSEAQRVLGLTYDDLTQRFVADFAPQTIWEDGSPCAVEDYPVTKCLSTNQPQLAATIGVRRPDDTVAWAVFTAVPLAEPETDGATGAVVTFLDITERKRVEEERQRLENQLRQFQKVEAIGTLAGGIAHDFNNILGAIIIHTEVAKTLLPLGSEVQEDLQNVLLAAGRAKDLVQQILTFSRQGDTQRQAVRLSPIIQDTLTLLRASFPTTIEIRQALPEEGDTILADPTQLHQIVLNLCVNAEHAMRETGGILTVNVDRVERDDVFALSHTDLLPGSHVRLTIRDSGHGMTPEVMERIFDPFFTTKDVGEGTGMGLALVHGTVTSHGGAITVESTPGAGTTFTLYFPCVQDTVVESKPPQDTVPHGTGHIMIVDDEPMLASGMKALLTQYGYEVVPYTSSQEALAAFEAQPERFDLVITDQTMPQMTGDQLARELRQRRPDIPIILCTGFSHAINSESVRDQGIDAYCMKPMNVDELMTTIQEVLEQRPPVERSSSSKRILIMDDDDQLRDGLRQMLETEGYEVVEARNGREGVRQYRVEPTDLIITDMLMPDQEGVETIQNLRRDFPDVKIIAISGGFKPGNLDVLDIARRLGVQRTLQKPFSRDELMIMIRDVL